MIAASQMIALRTRFAALTLFATRELLQASMQFFGLPTHVVRVLNHLRRQRLIWAISDHPVNVAVRGDQLEQPHLEGHFFQFHEQAIV